MAHAGAQSWLLNLSANFGDSNVAELALAAARGDTQKIDRLLGGGTNINKVGGIRANSLFWSFYAPNKAGFQHLLDDGADANARDQNGDAVMHLAAADEHPFYLRLAIAQRRCQSAS